MTFSTVDKEHVDLDFLRLSKKTLDVQPVGKSEIWRIATKNNALEHISPFKYGYFWYLS